MKQEVKSFVVFYFFAILVLNFYMNTNYPAIRPDIWLDMVSGYPAGYSIQISSQNWIVTIQFRIQFWLIPDGHPYTLSKEGEMQM